jgi:amidase
LATIAEKYGYEFKDSEKAEYTTLLAATCNAMQFISEMDGTLCKSFIHAE